VPHSLPWRGERLELKFYPWDIQRCIKVKEKHRREGLVMLRTIAILLILLAFLGGGIGSAAGMAVELLWLFLLLAIIGLFIGGFDYYRGPRDPLV
jgi:hypothetical protein